MTEISASRQAYIWFRRIVIYPILILMSFYTLLTGSPIPLWHIEELNNPRQVEEVTEDHLVLEDGTKLKIPLMKSLPFDNPLFLAALEDGVEVDEKNEVFARITLQKICGNDPYVCRRVRINLTDLCAAIDPNCIDKSIIPMNSPDDREFFEIFKIEPKYLQTDKLDHGVRYNMRHWREFFNRKLNDEKVR